MTRINMTKIVSEFPSPIQAPASNFCIMCHLFSNNKAFNCLSMPILTTRTYLSLNLRQLVVLIPSGC